MSESLNLEFRKIPSLQFLYEVNGDGSVIRNVKSKRHLKLFKKSHNGGAPYMCTQVNIKHHIRKVFAHVAVAECWIGAKPAGMQVDHIDRNSLNNDWHNLRYVTKSEQMLNRDYDRFLDKILPNLALRNCGHIVPVTLIRDGESVHFPTARRAAKYLASVYEKNEKSFNDKFYHRRSHIFDYDVVYGMQRLDTATPRGKEQSTKYLVGTMDKWNNAKRAEEADRVKHDLD